MTPQLELSSGPGGTPKRRQQEENLDEPQGALGRSARRRKTIGSAGAPALRRALVNGNGQLVGSVTSLLRRRGLSRCR
ncbi:hypothetical protein NDU88_007696 [Pleurodeles waltl]|uniref:Uncharacterized protein n=1 Tax=Pleurodeles waltl TaxID=8319 RepID=A0AAV7RT56_PLEWA|nr:hypothetical protein NDU88_007696 [Pleurodeles waltl]